MSVRLMQMNLAPSPLLSTHCIPTLFAHHLGRCFPPASIQTPAFPSSWHIPGWTFTLFLLFYFFGEVLGALVCINSGYGQEGPALGRALCIPISSTTCASLCTPN